MVLNGMDDMQARADESAKVLDYGYREFGLYPVAKAGDVMAHPTVWLGRFPNVAVVVTQDVQVTLPRSARSGLQVITHVDPEVAAPVVAGQVLGSLTITAPGMESKTIPLAAASAVEQVGFFSRIFLRLGRFFHGNKA